MGVNWKDKEFERREVNPALVKLLTRMGIQGEGIAKDVITGDPFPDLKAVDKNRLRSSLTYEVKPEEFKVRIGTNVEYAIFVFLGTVKMVARPVLRTMLALLKKELR